MNNCLSQAGERWLLNTTGLNPLKKASASKWDGQGHEPGDLIHRLRVKIQPRKSQIQHLTENPSLRQHYFLVPYLFFKIPQAIIQLLGTDNLEGVG